MADRKLFPGFGPESQAVAVQLQDMISVEKAGRRDLKAVVARVSADAGSDGDEDPNAAASRRSEQLLEALFLAILFLRSEAKRIAKAHALAQLAAIDRILEVYECPPIGLTTGSAVAGDELRARAVAQSMTARWSMAVNVNGEIAAAKAAMGPAIDRVATTETSHSMSEEADTRLEQAGRASPILWKRWEAQLDARTCNICANLDNTVVRASEPFPGDRLPGAVHPMCRCVEVPALHESDLNVGHAITREIVGPGLGRAAQDARGNFPVGGIEGKVAWPGRRDANLFWTDDLRAEWDRRWARATRDEAYRSRLLTPEIRRHMASKIEQLDAPLVPRIPRANPIAKDKRTPRQVHESFLGRKVGVPAARWEYGLLVPR